MVPQCTLVETNSYGKQVASIAVKELDQEKHQRKHTNTELVLRVGKTRQTIRKRIRTEDLPLSEFAGMADAIGVKPSVLLAKAEALHDIESISASIKNNQINTEKDTR